MPTAPSCPGASRSTPTRAPASPSSPWPPRWRRVRWLVPGGVVTPGTPLSRDQNCWLGGGEPPRKLKVEYRRRWRGVKYQNTRYRGSLPVNTIPRRGFAKYVWKTRYCTDFCARYSRILMHYFLCKSPEPHTGCIRLERHVREGEPLEQGKAYCESQREAIEKQ